MFRRGAMMGALSSSEWSSAGLCVQAPSRQLHVEGLGAARVGVVVLHCVCELCCGISLWMSG